MRFNAGAYDCQRSAECISVYCADPSLLLFCMCIILLCSGTHVYQYGDCLNCAASGCCAGKPYETDDAGRLCSPYTCLVLVCVRCSFACACHLDQSQKPGFPQKQNNAYDDQGLWRPSSCRNLLLEKGRKSDNGKSENVAALPCHNRKLSAERRRILQSLRRSSD